MEVEYGCISLLIDRLTFKKLLYGIKVRHRSDPYVELAERTLKCMTKALVFGGFRVDVFPIRELNTPEKYIVMI